MNIQEIEKAQEKWGNGIVKIGSLKDSIKECRMFAVDFISKMYDYDNGIRIQQRMSRGLTGHVAPVVTTYNYDMFTHSLGDLRICYM